MADNYDGKNGKSALGLALQTFCLTLAMVIAKAGTALANPVGKVDPVAVEDALKSVYDPEIPVNIYDLGLIYDVDRQQNGDVYVTIHSTGLSGCR